MRYTHCLLAVCLLLLVTACGGRKNVECIGDTDCDLSTGGACIMASTGNQWCAYPDTTCDSGFRFSDVDVGDDLGGVCVEGAPRQTLSVSVGGNGAGTVSSQPSGLTCTSGTCTGTFEVGTLVQLDAVAATGTFLGWSEACQGPGNCVVTMDRDLKVSALFGTPGQALWVNQVGGTAEDYGRGLATDADGKIVAVGFFSGTLQVGSQELTSAGGTDIYVVKMDGLTGNVIWAKRFGGANNEGAQHVATDATNNIYVVGEFSGPVDFGDGPLAFGGNSDALLLKVSADGNYVWSRSFGGIDYDFANDVAVKGTTIAIAGTFRSSMTINGTTLTSQGQADGFVATLDTAGVHRWARGIGGNSLDFTFAIEIDNTGDVLVGGRFVNTVNFGASPVTSAGGADAYVAKYAGSDGTYRFAKTFGSTGSDQVASIGVDASDNIFLVGAFSGTVSFGGATPLSATTFDDIFVAKYSLAGAHLWSKGFGSTTYDLANSATVNAAGDVAIVGSFCGTISFGGDMLSSANKCDMAVNDLFAARFAGNNGSHINSVRAGGSGSEEGIDVAQTADGRFYVTGMFAGFAEFGGKALTSRGGNDAFVLGLAPL